MPSSTMLSSLTNNNGSTQSTTDVQGGENTASLAGQKRALSPSPLPSDINESGSNDEPSDNLSPDSSDLESEYDVSQNYKRRRMADSPAYEGHVRYTVIHEVVCRGQHHPIHREHPQQARYYDAPRLYALDCAASPLHGQCICSLSSKDYIKAHPEVSLVAFRQYDCETYHQSLEDSFEATPLPFLSNPREEDKIRPYYSILRAPGPEATPGSEWLKSLSPDLIAAMAKLERADSKAFNQWDSPADLCAPYVRFHHNRQRMTALALEILTENEKSHIDALLQYLEETSGSDYSEAANLFSQGLVTLKHLPMVFRAHEIIISFRDDHPQGFLTSHCHMMGNQVRLQCSTWSFNGVFKRKPVEFTVKWPGDPDEQLEMHDLEVFPLRYDQSGLKERLLARAAIFWSCRLRRFVGYQPPRRTFELRITNPRYMVDVGTYNELHQDNDPSDSVRNEQEELDPHLIETDDPPSEEFALQLPAHILGFGLHDKKWINLQVERIQEIQWNKKAFERLVLDHDKKRLITAMVQGQIQFDTSADIIEGKGNGLIILLHGGPGTGKTLTAESVAELAERPLYRVTCGDVGTDPESVEKYLESVLYIATIWQAVVLFDESDVFLEERTQADLQRNALVSVFLRVLEYYNGILILATNRVGTFDEAFKSRVQLALHYPAIDERGRKEIWSDFIHDLEKQGADANFEKLKSQIATLAGEVLNGRQIRNAIRTARQVAAQEHEPLSYDHLQRAIRVAQEFEKYVVDTHGGNTHEEFAKARNLRSN